MSFAFKNIDDALALYYQRYGHSNYRNGDDNGIFLQYIIDEELDDEDLPIENELGEGCDPNDCAYSWMNDETEFPIPGYAVIDDKQKEAFIFLVLQFCWKHSVPPSDQYIKQTLLPQVGGYVVFDNGSPSADISAGAIKENESGNDAKSEECDAVQLDLLISTVIDAKIYAWNQSVTSFPGRIFIDCNRVKDFCANTIYSNLANIEAYNREEFVKLFKVHCDVPIALCREIWKCIFKLKAAISQQCLGARSVIDSGGRTGIDGKHEREMLERSSKTQTDPMTEQILVIALTKVEVLATENAKLTKEDAKLKTEIATLTQIIINLIKK